MNVKTALTIFAIAISVCAPSFGMVWSNKNVGRLSSTYDSADCIYFTLEGVTEADPIKPGDPMFAIPRTQYGAKDGYAMLLSAKLTGQPVFVVTRGTLACGYASVAQILMQ